MTTQKTYMDLGEEMPKTFEMGGETNGLDVLDVAPVKVKKVKNINTKRGATLSALPGITPKVKAKPGEHGKAVEKRVAKAKAKAAPAKAAKKPAKAKAKGKVKPAVKIPSNKSDANKSAIKGLKTSLKQSTKFDLKALAADILARRERDDLSFRVISEATGIAKSTLGDIETGKVSPKMESFAAICDFLGVNPSKYFHVKKD